MLISVPGTNDDINWLCARKYSADGLSANGRLVEPIGKYWGSCQSAYIQLLLPPGEMLAVKASLFNFEYDDAFFTRNGLRRALRVFNSGSAKDVMVRLQRLLTLRIMVLLDRQTWPSL